MKPNRYHPAQRATPRPEPPPPGAGAHPEPEPVKADPGIPDAARFFAKQGTLPHDHFGDAPVTAAAIRRRNFSPEVFIALGFLRPIPDGF